MDLIDFDLKIRQGRFSLAGLDEAGRGPLAGPIYAAAVIMDLSKPIEDVDDSKKLTAKTRESLYEQIIQRAISYSICKIDADTIDEIGIQQANKLVLQNALNGLSIMPDIAIIDYIKIESTRSEAVFLPKADSTSYNVACASILAKVARDRQMQELDKLYPQYNFAQHKGYSTKAHMDAIKKFGLSAIHRKAFCKNFLQQNG